MTDKTITEAKTQAAALIALGALLGKVQTNPAAEGRPFVLLPNGDGGFCVEYLEVSEYPRRAAGTHAVADVDSFVALAKRHYDGECTMLYADLQAKSFTAVLNDHGEKGEPNWRDHRIALVLEHSDEYDAWASHDKKPMSQEDFAYFIQEQLHDFREPTAAKMLEVAINFRAKKQVHYRGSQVLSNGSVDLEYSEHVEGSVGPTGKMSVPDKFTIEIPVWSGLAAKKYRFEAQLKYRLDGPKLWLHYELLRPTKVIELAFKDSKEAIEKALDHKFIFGTP